MIHRNFDIEKYLFFQKTVSQNLKNTVPISTTCTVTADPLDNNVDSTTGSLNQIETIEVAPESASNGNGTTTMRAVAIVVVMALAMNMVMTMAM